MNVVGERILHFIGGLAHTGENYFRGVAPGLQDTIEFAARDDIESGAGFGEQLEDRAIGVRLGGVTDQVIERRERRAESAIMIEERARAIDIKGRAEFFGRGPERDVFAKQLALAVVE